MEKLYADADWLDTKGLQALLASPSEAEAVDEGRRVLTSFVNNQNQMAKQRRGAHLHCRFVVALVAAVIGMALWFSGFMSTPFGKSHADFPAPSLFSDEYKTTLRFSRWGDQVLKRIEGSSSVRLRFEVLEQFGPVYSPEYRACIKKSSSESAYCSKHLSQVYVVAPHGFDRGVMLVEVSDSMKLDAAETYELSGELVLATGLLNRLKVNFALSANKKDMSSFGSVPGEIRFDKKRILLPLALHHDARSDAGLLTEILEVINLEDFLYSGSFSGCFLWTALVMLLVGLGFWAKLYGCASYYGWKFVVGLGLDPESVKSIDLQDALSEISWYYVELFKGKSEDDVQRMILADIGLSQHFGILQNGNVEGIESLLSQNWLLTSSHRGLDVLHLGPRTEWRRNPRGFADTWLESLNPQHGAGFVARDDLPPKIFSAVGRRLMHSTWQHLQAIRQCNVPLFVSMALVHVVAIDPVTLFPRELNTHDATTSASIQGSALCTVDQEPCKCFIISAGAVYSWSVFAGHILEKNWHSDQKIVVVSQAREKECHGKVICLQTDPLRNVIEVSALLDYHAQELSKNMKDSAETREANVREMMRALQAILPPPNQELVSTQPRQLV